jgi:hypothetical protein
MDARMSRSIVEASNIRIKKIALSNVIRKIPTLCTEKLTTRFFLVSPSIGMSFSDIEVERRGTYVDVFGNTT